jgi:hypothetical protein
MKIYTKHNVHEACKRIVHEQLDKFEHTYSLIGISEVELQDAVMPAKLRLLQVALGNYGCEIVKARRVFLSKG